MDTSAARKVPGVHAVYTSDDVLNVIAEPYYGPAFHDQPILAIGKVHFVGEPVAVVLAGDPHVADQAAQQIVAEYEELPAVFDEVEAAENKTLVHDELKPAGTFADLKHLKGRKGTNIALDFRLRRGDVDKAFAAAAHVFEHTFRTQKVLHLPLEPHASIADYRDDGVTIYSSAQGPSFVRTEIARLLGWPENRVRIKVPYLGGGYGGKLYIKLEALAIAMVPGSAVVALFSQRRLRDPRRVARRGKATLADTLVKTWGATLDPETTPRLSLPFDRARAHQGAAVPVLAAPDNPDTPLLAASAFDPVVGDTDALGRRLSQLRSDGIWRVRRGRRRRVGDAHRAAARRRRRGRRSRRLRRRGTGSIPGCRRRRAADRGRGVPGCSPRSWPGRLTGRPGSPPAAWRAHAVPTTTKISTKGDFVVHRVHGVGRYFGMETKEMFGVTRDRLVVEFKGGDGVRRLRGHRPAAQVHRW